MNISTTPYFQLGPGFWASIPEKSHHELLRHYAARAGKLLARHHLCLPDGDRLELIVRAAMGARALYFAAALYEPTIDDLDGCFDGFVVWSVSGIPDLEEGYL